MIRSVLFCSLSVFVAIPAGAQDAEPLGTLNLDVNRLGTCGTESYTVRIGMVTDLHYADKPPAGSRHYRETLRKFEEAAKQFASDGVDFVVELGDFIDAADSLETEKAYLTTMTKPFAATPGQHHYVLGNHCVYALAKGEFLEIVGQPKSYYSFDVGGYHFVVLDACFRSDGQPYGRKTPSGPIPTFQQPKSSGWSPIWRRRHTRPLPSSTSGSTWRGTTASRMPLRCAGSWRSQAKCSPSSRATTTEMTSKRLAAPATALSPRWSRVAVRRQRLRCRGHLARRYDPSYRVRGAEELPVVRSGRFRS